MYFRGRPLRPSEIVDVALGSGAGARMIDQNSPHGARYDRKKVGPSCPVDTPDRGYTKICLVNQRGGLKGVGMRFSVEVISR